MISCYLNSKVFTAGLSSSGVGVKQGNFGRLPKKLPISK